MRCGTLISYAFSLRFFSQVLLRPPDESLLRAIVQGGLFRSFTDWPCFCAAEQPIGPAGFCSTQSVERLSHAYAVPENSGDVLTIGRELLLDHLDLFSGPTPKAPPWESVWRERDRLLFGLQTEKVRQCYLTWGLNTENADREPEDHLGLELAFTLFLVQAAYQQPVPVSKGGMFPEKALADFLDEHVLAWVDSCLNTATKHASTVFYREIPVLCLVMLRNLRQDVASIQNVVDP